MTNWLFNADIDRADPTKAMQRALAWHKRRIPWFCRTVKVRYSCDKIREANAGVTPTSIQLPFAAGTANRACAVWPMKTAAFITSFRRLM